MTTTPTTAQTLPLLRPSTRDELLAAVQAAIAAHHRLQIQGSNSMPPLENTAWQCGARATPDLENTAWQCGARPASDRENTAWQCGARPPSDRGNTAWQCGARATPDPRPIKPLSTLRLSKIVEHAISDMTVIVDAGISLEALQTQLAWHNQWLPIDPPALNSRNPRSRTLGGLVATNSLGPLRHGCGDWRLLLLGMKFIDSTGTLIKGGGRTMKFSAGYSTPRLMIGSAGSLGIITELTLRTYARPADEQALIIFCRSPEQAEQMLADILLAPITPAYIQAIGPQAFKLNPLDLPAQSIVLAVGFLGHPATCTAQINLLRNLPIITGRGTTPAVETISQTAPQSARLRLWMTTEPTGDFSFRIHTLSSHVTTLIAQIESLANTHNATAWLVSEAATALLRGTISNLSTTTAPPLLTQLQTLARKTNSTLQLTGTTFPLSEFSIQPSALLSSLKSQLDPQNLFPA